jgi:hypothetical protein
LSHCSQTRADAGYRASALVLPLRQLEALEDHGHSVAVGPLPDDVFAPPAGYKLNQKK